MRSANSFEEAAFHSGALKKGGRHLASAELVSFFNLIENPYRYREVEWGRGGTWIDAGGDSAR
jgi:hypothetical protein